ncbi:hypothetical protein [Salinibacter ruber]|uniref:hypothetical protein n=1 Tax=Salinibacter ruber TaxID=146919 RepID=UPI000E58B534|nr:hypothetical protein [Salinibacter ruber]
MSWTVGLDIGQSQDHSALTAVESTEIEGGGTERVELWDKMYTEVPQEATCAYALRHVHRFDLGTPYPKMVKAVAELMQADPLAGSAGLVVDATGVGRPIVEMLEEEGLSPSSIWITGGDSVSRDGREYRVPKRELASTVQALLQSGRLKFAENLPLRDVLVDELQKFRAKINIDTGEASFEHWRERDTDDVVLSLACALWHAERPESGFVIV